MRKKNRGYCLTAALTMTAMLATACGSAQEEPAAEKAAESTQEAANEKTTEQAAAETSQETAQADDHEPVTLRFSWWGGDSRNEATVQVIEQFEAEYPWITVEPEYGSSDGYSDKLATQLSSGTEPDIMQIDPETMPQFVAAGDYFVDFFETDFDFSNYDVDAIMGSTITGCYDGKQYGIPTGVAGPCLLINKTLADEVGIDLTGEYTWDDLIEMGKKVQEYDSSKYLISTNMAYLNNMFVNYYMKQLSGNTLFDVESGKLLATEENLTKTFEYIKSLFDNNVVPAASTMAQYEGDNLQADPDWIAGNYVCNFTYISTAEVLTAANENAEYIAGEFPVMEGAKNDGFIVGCPQIIAVSKNSENVEAAIMFLNYFFNNDTALSTLATQRSVPFTAHAREIVEADGNLSELLSTSVDILTPYAGLANDPIGSTSEAKQIMQDAIENVAFGEMTPQEAATEVITAYGELEK